jgi:hypothetical protein
MDHLNGRLSGYAVDEVGPCQDTEETLNLNPSDHGRHLLPSCSGSKQWSLELPLHSNVAGGANLIALRPVCCRIQYAIFKAI